MSSYDQETGYTRNNPSPRLKLGQSGVQYGVSYMLISYNLIQFYATYV